ncbi:MAG: DCC1-like thiol-disulfide oxidoreductase family protein [Dehalococcoidia bacterium]
MTNRDEAIAAPTRPVLIYGSDCRFCCAAARWVARLDTSEELAFVPLDSPEAARLLAETPAEERDAHWHYVTLDGEDMVGGPAAIVLFRQLGRTRHLARAAGALRLAPLVTAGDWILQKVRPHLGRFFADQPGPMRYP